MHVHAVQVLMVILLLGTQGLTGSPASAKEPVLGWFIVILVCVNVNSLGMDVDTMGSYSLFFSKAFTKGYSSFVITGLL